LLSKAGSKPEARKKLTNALRLKDDERAEPEEGPDVGSENEDGELEPSPPPEPRPAHPHPSPDPRPATPATPPGRDEGVDCASPPADGDDGVPALVATRHSSMSTTASTSFSSASRPHKADFIDDVSGLLRATAIGDAPAVFADDDEALVAADDGDEAEDPDRPWIYGRTEAERRYSNEMRRHTLGAMEKLMRAGRDAPQKRKKRGSIRGRPDSSVIFET
jgi:hypothetical protein